MPRTDNIPPERFVALREKARVSMTEIRKRFPKAPDWESGKSSPDWSELQEYAQSLLSNAITLYTSNEDADMFQNNFFHRRDETEPRILDHRIPKDLPDPGLPLRESFHRASNVQDEFMTMAVQTYGSEMFDPEKIPSRKELEQIQNFQDLVTLLDNHRIVVLAEIVLPMEHGDPDILADTTLNPEEFHGFTLVDNLAPIIFLNLWSPDNKQSLLHAVDLIREKKTAIYHIDPDACGISPEQVQKRAKQYQDFRDQDSRDKGKGKGSNSKRGKDTSKNSTPNLLFLQHGDPEFQADPDQEVLPMSLYPLLWLNMSLQESKILYREMYNYTGRPRTLEALVAKAEEIWDLQKQQDR